MRKTPKPKLNPQTLAILGRHIQQNQPNKAAEEISRDFEAAMRAAGPKQRIANTTKLKGKP